MKIVNCFMIAILATTLPLTLSARATPVAQLSQELESIQHKLQEFKIGDYSAMRRLRNSTTLVQSNPALCCEKFISEKRLRQDPCLAAELIDKKMQQLVAAIWGSTNQAEISRAQHTIANITGTLYDSGFMNYMANYVANDIINTTVGRPLSSIRSYLERIANHFHGEAKQTALQLAHYDAAYPGSALPPLYHGVISAGNAKELEALFTELTRHNAQNLQRLAWFKVQVGFTPLIAQAEAKITTACDIMTWVRMATHGERQHRHYHA